MNDFDDSYRAVPLHIMAASLIVMMILDFMPFSFDGFFWLPEMTALMLLYWTLHQPQRAGMGLAFAIGLIVDAATAATLGLHALSYVAMTYFILNRRRQIMLYGHIMQLGRCIGCAASQSGCLNCCPFVPQSSGHHFARLCCPICRRIALADTQPADADCDPYLPLPLKR